MSAFLPRLFSPVLHYFLCLPLGFSHFSQHARVPCVALRSPSVRSFRPAVVCTIYSPLLHLFAARVARLFARGPDDASRAQPVAATRTAHPCVHAIPLTCRTVYTAGNNNRRRYSPGLTRKRLREMQFCNASRGEVAGTRASERTRFKPFYRRPRGC